MPTLAIYEQLEKDLAEDFKELRIRESLYVSPRFIWEALIQNLEMQIVEGGGTYKDFEGGIRSGDFRITIGIFYTSIFDAQSKFRDGLLRDTQNIYTLKERVITSLEGSFLTDHLLTRPLRVVDEAPVIDNPKFNKWLLKTVSFVGGHNAERPR